MIKWILNSSHLSMVDFYVNYKYFEVSIMIELLNDLLTGIMCVIGVEFAIVFGRFAYDVIRDDEK